MNDATRSQTTEWNPELYDTKHAFVAQFGSDVVELLNPQPSETVLDLGCGTGHLTQQIASRGAIATGIDSSASMIEQARVNYPQLQFEVGDATQLNFTEAFDAVFSNAVLHWVKPPEQAIASIWRVLKPGGRFVAEFGGKGNVKAITEAIAEVAQTTGYGVGAARNPWYFPSIGEYASLLEQQGFDVTFAVLFDRPTPLEGNQGIQNWITMFGNSFLQTLSLNEQAQFLTDIETRLRPTLCRDGVWFADYRRIRVVAVKPN